MRNLTLSWRMSIWYIFHCRNEGIVEVQRESRICGSVCTYSYFTDTRNPNKAREVQKEKLYLTNLS